MTGEQERAIEALSLSGYATAGEECLLVRNAEGFAVVKPDGEIWELGHAAKITPFRRFMADTYGRGETP